MSLGSNGLTKSASLMSSILAENPESDNISFVERGTSLSSLLSLGLRATANAWSLSFIGNDPSASLLIKLLDGKSK